MTHILSLLILKVDWWQLHAICGTGVCTLKTYAIRRLLSQALSPECPGRKRTHTAFVELQFDAGWLADGLREFGDTLSGECLAPWMDVVVWGWPSNSSKRCRVVARMDFGSPLLISSAAVDFSYQNHDYHCTANVTTNTTTATTHPYHTTPPSPTDVLPHPSPIFPPHPTSLDTLVIETAADYHYHHPGVAQSGRAGLNAVDNAKPHAKR